MTTQPDPDLRTTLHRLADSTDPLPVADDLWARGQSSRHRGQALVVAAVLAIIVSVGGVASLVTADREARTASGEVPGGAIPSRIEDIPDDLDVTTDLAIGLGSAAFISGGSDPVVITATDGVPHRLALPGWVSNGTEAGDVRLNQSLALSPDGARLAWQAADADDGRATVGVLDLETGRTSTYPLPPSERLRLREMSWSPDSSWLAWIADVAPAAWVGRLRPGPDADVEVTEVFGNVPDVAVDANGTLVLSRASGGLQRIDDSGAPLPLVRKGDLAGAAVGAGRFSSDGRYLALRSSLAPASYTLDMATDEVLQHPFPDGTFADGSVLPQGWLDDRLQLLLVQEYATPDRLELVITTPERGDASTWRRSVGVVVETGPATTLSLAVDLVPDLDGTSSQELTHDFGDVLADQQRDISWIIGLGVAAAIALLMALRWLWRRFVQ
ncbi:hypothetical protein GCM10023339_18020 [Alloalcanivorax gelatiniphagus]